MATPSIQTKAVQAATDTVSYGADANPTGNPIGGGDGYVSPHGYSQSTADYVVTTATELSTALASATAGQVIWIPSGTTINLTTAYGKTLRSGVVLASDRGQNGAPGGKIKTTYEATAFMTPILWCASNSVVCGLVFEGPGGIADSSGPRNCALRGLDSAKRIEVENCEISEFAEGGIYFYGGGMAWDDDSSSGRHWVHHCNIHNIQKHGFGYGIAEEGGCAYLAEWNIFTDSRHHIMAQAGNNHFEVRYNVFNDARYYISGTLYYNTQVDCHGSGTSTSPSAGGTLVVHHNTFSANSGKVNVGIRGIPANQCLVYNNWTKKITHAGLYTETTTNSAFTLLGSGGGPWPGSSTLSTYKMYVYDNWYGTSAPPSTPSSNHAPVLSAIGNKSVGEGATLTFTVSASDADGDALTYSASNLPSGATFTPSTRTFSWKPASGQCGIYTNVHFEVSDGSLTDSEDITITVTAFSTNSSSTAPTLISPGDGTRVSGTSVTFRWNALSGATKYFLIVSTSPDLDVAQASSRVRKVWRQLGNVTQYTVTGFSNRGTTYYWWVYAGNSSGWSTEADVVANGGWSLVNGAVSETSSIPAAPTLLSPANEANVPGTSVTFQWNASLGATKYFLIVSTSPSLSTTQSNSSVRKYWGQVNGTEYTVTGFPNNGTTYYWWVYAGSSTGWSTQAQVVASGGWSFINGS